ncbi:MAG: TIGR04283 family arsenosugar biosynthesis glycosyltransferase, partial [Bacteroidota bacterium]
PTTISIVIPTLNEADCVGKLVNYLFQHQTETLAEIIVVDGKSSDRTVATAQKMGAKVVISPKRGRANQMNLGSKIAKGDILYFVHCDTFPPTTYLSDIQAAVRNGFPIGCFQTKFDTNRTLVKTNSWWSQFDFLFCRGGDQTLFVTKKVFDDLDGYKEMRIMEEYDFLIRARKKYPFKIIPSRVLVSARKYDNRSYVKVQFANVIVFNMFRFGASQDRLVRTYRQLLG